MKLAIQAIALAAAPAALAAPQAQRPADVTPVPIAGQVRNAGTYHVATGTWTRPGKGASISRGIGPDVVYDNTAPSGFFLSVNTSFAGYPSNSWVHDWGGLPGTTNTTPFGGTVDRDEYRVNGFQFAYCDLNPAPTSLTSSFQIQFYAAYVPCTTPSPAPNGFVELSNMPANGCWVVDIDLGPDFSWCLPADGSPDAPGFDADPDLDSFGYRISYARTNQSGPAGPILAGDPSATDASWTPGTLPMEGGGTYYGGTTACGGGTGYLSQDQLFVIDPTGVSPNNCFDVGGYVGGGSPCSPGTGAPWASLYMRMYADSGECSIDRANCSTAPPGGHAFEFCTSNPNSTGSVAGLQVCGHPSAAFDDVLLQGTNVPPGAWGFFLTSRTPNIPFMPPNSQGIACLGGSIGRFALPGQIKQADASGLIGLDTALGEWSVTAIPTSTVSYGAVPLETTRFQLWYRDSVGGAATSNFSNAVQHLWR